MKRLSMHIKDIKGFFPALRTGLVFFVAVLPLILPMYAVEALSAPSGGMDFDIPTAELSRAKKGSAAGEAGFDIPVNELKETKAKPVASRTKKKKRSVAKASGSETAATAPTQSSDQAKSPVSVTADVAPVSESQNLPLQPEPMQPFRVFNVPYSFVVTGKSTVIRAVIYREANDLQAVNCKIRSTDSGAMSVVKMAKVEGSRFTYMAILPEVPGDAASLRYRVVAVDSSDRESASPEFATPVKFSPLVPGWQF
jgi:hypothetical protein